MPRILHSCLRKSKYQYRVAERIAELEVAAGRDRDELLAVNLKHGRRRVDPGAAIELPQHRAAFGVVRFEPAVPFARKHEATSSRGRAADHRLIRLRLPRLFPGLVVDRGDRAPLRFAWNRLERAAKPQ